MERGGRYRRLLSIGLAWVALILVLFVLLTASLSAAVPVSTTAERTEGTGNEAQSHFDGEEIDHRKLLRKRHEQISSGSVATGFAHPTHLYRRDADALPPPDKAYNMSVTQGIISPDGFERLGFLMNGNFPADPFVWDENDDVEINVINNGPVPFAIHWHGIHQIGSPEMDGVPGLSQWNIYPGESYTYRFKLVNQYGGYWYHSHERGYYADGLRGTIYIRPKPGRQKPWSYISTDQDDIEQMEAAEHDSQIMSLSDHWHINHTEMLLVVHETGVPPACFDSLHINGRGRQYCVNNWSKVISPIQASLLRNFSSTNPEGITSKGCISLVPPKSGYTVKGTLDERYGGVCQNTTAPLTVFSAAKAIKKGRRWLNLQVVDTATNWYYGISVDSHKMWIVAVDGHYIQPMQVDWAQITIGSRLSVMIQLDPALDGNMFPIRLTGARALQPIEGHAFLSYIDDVDGTWNPGQEEDFGYLMRTLTTAHVPMSGFVSDPSVVKWKQNLSVPFDPINQVPQTSNMTLHAVASQNSLNVWQVATMPLDTARLADDRPILFNATDGNATLNQMTPYASIPFGTVVDVIMENNIYSIVGGPNSPHPFHMHSRRFWIIGSGAGPFPADTVAEAQGQGILFNLETPPLRDGFDIDSNSWVVIRYVADHAAANILHCHIDDHAIEGMAAVLLEGLEKIPAGGNFSDTIKARPSKWVETKNDELGQVLEASWATGSANAKYVAPAPTDTVDPWGDPRSLAQSIQLYASSNSVLKAITSSLVSEMGEVKATATGVVTAITATVSDHLTTFTGVAASSSVFATTTASVTLATVTENAVASASSTAIVATATESASASVASAQSLAAVASTTTALTLAVETLTSMLSVSASQVINTVVSATDTSAAAVATSNTVTSINTAQSTLFAIAFTTEVVTASAAETPTVKSSVETPAIITSSSTVYVTVLATVAPTLSLSSLAAQSTKSSSSAAIKTTNASSTRVSLASQTTVAAVSTASLVSLLPYTTLYATVPASTALFSTGTSTLLKLDGQTAAATTTKTATSPSLSTQSASRTDADSGIEDDDVVTEETDNIGASATTSLSSQSMSSSANLRVASANLVLTTSVVAADSTGTAQASSTVVNERAGTTTIASLNRAASTHVSASTTSARAVLTEVATTSATQTPHTTIFESQASRATSQSTSSGSEAASPTANAAKYGTHSAATTFLAYSTSVETSVAALTSSSATVSEDEPAYDNPVFPSSTGAVSTSTTTAATQPTNSFTSSGTGNEGESGGYDTQADG